MALALALVLTSAAAADAVCRCRLPCADMVSSQTSPTRRKATGGRVRLVSATVSHGRKMFARRPCLGSLSALILNA